MKFVITEQERRHILSLYLLAENFDTQATKFISQGYNKNIVKKYLDDFSLMKDRGYKEMTDSDLPTIDVPKGVDRLNINNYKTFKEVETIVDYVAGQRNVGSANFTDIEVDGTPIFENDDVEIYYAPTADACIKYKGDKPYSWCVSNKHSSMFLTYRAKFEEPTFYFVKLKKRTEIEFSKIKNDFQGNFNDKWHFFVVQVTINGQYIVTSAINDGDNRMSWDDILKVAPELTGLQKYFKHVSVSEHEKNLFKLQHEDISDEEFSKFPYITKRDYILALQWYMDISDSKFFDLPEDLKSIYVGQDRKLTDTQYEYVMKHPKLIKRFVKRFFGEFEEVKKHTYHEFLDLLAKPNEEEYNAKLKFLEKFQNPSFIFDNINKDKMLEWGNKKEYWGFYNSYVMAMIYYVYSRNLNWFYQILDYFGITIDEFVEYFKKNTSPYIASKLAKFFGVNIEYDETYYRECNRGWKGMNNLEVPDDFFDGKKYKEYEITTYDEWLELRSKMNNHQKSFFRLDENMFKRYQKCGGLTFRFINVKV